MLTSVKRKAFHAKGHRFAIVASRYNARYVDAMVRAAQDELRDAGTEKVETIRVPGAYEIPVVVAQLARSGQMQGGTPSAIICLGVILRGETAHATHIGEAVSRGLMEIQLQSGVPVIHEVLLLENEAQARARCLNRQHNRGTEAAQTALAMAEVMTRLRLRSGLPGAAKLD
ncbi:MAG TPA: 6,7-dimethyl-8-ribityllumazine synthase [Candidatus Limnocylindrales bacterium]|nr:6,7-dimethyl-8-ribityllumazine synthase [Candidatus Limnocylindrales bacterium]